MRPIKFNAWIPELNIMLENITVYPDMIGCSLEHLESKLPPKHHVYVDEVYISDFEGGNDIYEFVMSILPGDEWVYLESGQYELLQFTGLQDKNHANIYEGHILKDSTGKYMVVEWSEKFASFVLNRTGWAFSHWFGESCKPEDCEIVGNKYQNSELL